MSNKNNQAYTRHHYLQKAYLDRFTESGKIDVILRQTGEARKGPATSSIRAECPRSCRPRKDRKDRALRGPQSRKIPRIYRQAGVSSSYVLKSRTDSPLPCRDAYATYVLIVLFWVLEIF